MKSDAQLNSDYEAAETKDAKTRVLTAWSIDPEKGYYYKTLTAFISTEQSLKKTEKWESWKSLSSRFDEDEIQELNNNVL